MQFLIVIAGIAATAWLIDCVWEMLTNRSAKPHLPPPIPFKPQNEAQPEPKSSQKLRDDWLRLGRRSQ